ncbi:MAG: methyltransferase domain-containing protein, partial [Bacteroidota bacterium]
MNLYRIGLKRLLALKRTVFGPVDLTMPRRREFGVHAGTPVDRYYINRFLQQHMAGKYASTLEIGSRQYTGKTTDNSWMFCYSPDGFSVDESQRTVSGDLSSIPADGKVQFDCFVLTQTFNFIFDFEKAVDGAMRLLKDNGEMLVTFAGPSVQISRYDEDRWGDYWRFTPRSARELFNRIAPSGQTEVVSYG